MNNFYMNIYKDFKCTADKCENSCCENWEVTIDNESFEKFGELDGELKKKIDENTEYEGECLIFKNSHKRCPFLNDKNLCEIIINANEKYIPKTCKIYPRFIRTYGGRKEFGLSLSCPEVVRLFLKNDFKILKDTDDEPPKLWDADAQTFITLYSKRQKMLSADSFHPTKTDLTILENCEYISDFIPKLLKNSTSKIRDINNSLLLKIYKYFTFKYFLDSLEGEDMTDFINFNTCAIKQLIENSTEKPEKIIMHYSREIEHSEINIDIIKKYLHHFKTTC